jgi:hypothetical protein
MRSESSVFMLFAACPFSIANAFAGWRTSYGLTCYWPFLWQWNSILRPVMNGVEGLVSLHNKKQFTKEFSNALCYSHDGMAQ